jgi:ABC-type polysaccharide/polyol phosphate export permease/Flp pilus assembly protein TadD
LSDALEYPKEATGDAALSRAPSASGLDCRGCGPANCAPDEQRAMAHCRQAERAFYEGDLPAAGDYARSALALCPEAEPIADFCAWLFSNSGRHGEAAAAYEQLLAHRIGWAAGHRHASGSFAAAGDLDRAIQHAARASEIEPGSSEFAVHTGCLFTRAGLHRDAIEYFSRAAAIEPDNPAILRHLAEAAFAVDDRQAAIELAARAHALTPRERRCAHFLTELLLRSERFAEAVEVISAALAGDAEDAVGWRLLSAAEMTRGYIESAIAAIDRALALAPAVAEYHVHRGNLLYRIGNFDDAAAALDRAASLDPENPAARRSQLAVYCDSGRFRDALEIGGELIRAAPENEEYARAVLHVLTRRLEAIDGDYIVLGERTERPEPACPPRQGWWAAFRTQWRVVHALIIRETRTRFGDARLGYGWALLEPILHILTLSLFFAVLMHGRPPIGTQFFIFYYTGLIPYHVFVHTSSSMTYAVTSNGSLLQLPLVGTFDVIIARALLELATDLLVAVLLLAGFGALGLGTLPNDFGGVAASIAAVWVFACGCGFINAVINAFCKSWDKIWNQVTRILYFCSGIFYVPGNMPDWVRDILTWNPVLHAVDWFRSGFFVDYQPHWLDRTFLASVAVSTLLAGIGLERCLRRQLYEPQ